MSQVFPAPQGITLGNNSKPPDTFVERNPSVTADVLAFLRTNQIKDDSEYKSAELTTTLNNIKNALAGVGGGGGGGGTSRFTIVGTGGDYATITAALAANAQNIFIKNGTYNEGGLVITYDNVNIIGESKNGVQIIPPVEQNGFVIYANHVTLENLTVDCSVNSAEACIVLGDGSTAGTPDITKGNYNKIRNCHMEGKDGIFALYVAGASTSAGVQTLEAYRDRNLQIGNEITYCTGHSPWDGDAYAFCLQAFGKISNNVFRGRVAFYMNRESECCHNRFYDSPNQGIFIAGPCNDNVISNNNIYNSAHQGIKIENQLEHTPLLAGQDVSGNVIANNTVHDAAITGMEIVGTEANPITKNIISANTIIRPGNHGFYLQDTISNQIVDNMVDTPRSNPGAHDRGSGIYMVLRVKNNLISGNSIVDTRSPHICHTGIANREDATCTGNIIDSNYINCNNLERTIWFQSNGQNITNNVVRGGYYAGLRLEGASMCNVVGNRFFDNTNESNNSYPEIWVQSASAKNFISNNYIYSSGTPKALNGILLDEGCTANVVSVNMFDNVTNTVVDSDGGNTIPA